jgi:hypothetical protein
MSWLRKIAGAAAPILGNAIVPGLGGIAGGFLGSAIGGGGRKKKQAAQNPGLAGFDARVARMGQRGEDVERQYLNRVQNFDPMAAATQAAQGQYNLMLPQITQGIADLRGMQAGQGRLRSGYGMHDQDEFLSRNYQHLNDSMVARAMEAARMGMDNTNALGSYATNSQNMYLDATMGRYMTEEQRRQAEEASKRGMWGNLLGAGIGAAGTYFGARAGRA